MRFKHLATTALPVDPQFQWLWYSNQTCSFIFGDDRNAFALPVSNPAAPSSFTPARPFDNRIPPHHPCNLPIPDSLYEEMTSQPWHGFHFLEPGAYELSVDCGEPADGDLLRTLVFGLNYGHLLLHRASNLIFRHRSGSMELLERSANGFRFLAKTRTRGSAIMDFAAHPIEPMIAYGDNAGNFHAHRFDADGFGKASKIAARQRKASRIEFLQSGQRLMIGGMGYLAALSYSGGKFVPVDETSTPVRDFVLACDEKVVLVNQGLHGVTAYNSDGLVKAGALEPQVSVREIAVSGDWRYLAVAMQDTTAINIYEILADS
ncbi:MAG TPA: hypothetical protein VI685_02495 [Candidatus Angelobacter sp.]